MFLFVVNAKMSLSMRGTIQDEAKRPKPDTPLSNVVQAISRRPAISDLLVTATAVPLLIACALLLFSYMRTDWIRDSQSRFRVLGLGLALLFISLVVCIYATKRLGLCTWPQQPQEPQIACRRRTLSARLQPRESQMQLFVATELPPSYDSVISSDFPPPYSSITFHISTETGQVMRSTLTPVHSGPRPPGMG